MAKLGYYYNLFKNINSKLLNFPYFAYKFKLLIYFTQKKSPKN